MSNVENFVFQENLQKILEYFKKSQKTLENDGILKNVSNAKMADSGDCGSDDLIFKIRFHSIFQCFLAICFAYFELFFVFIFVENFSLNYIYLQMIRNIFCKKVTFGVKRKALTPVSYPIHTDQVAKVSFFVIFAKFRTSDAHLVLPIKWIFNFFYYLYY